MKKILIVAGSAEQLPLINYSKKMGFYSICVDRDENCLGAKYSDKFYKIDIKNKKKIYQIAIKHKINGLTTSCSEAAVPTICYIAEKLGLRGNSIQTGYLTTNKILMKNKLRLNNIKTSDFFKIKNIYQTKNIIINKKNRYVLKPDDAFAQRGVYLLSDKKRLKKKLTDSKSFSSSKTCILEKFVNGPEINLAAIIYNKKVKIISVSERLIYKDQYFGIAYMHLSPTLLNKNQLNLIKSTVTKAIKATGMTNGASEIQTIFDPKTNKVSIIEIASRTPGGLLKNVAFYNSGIDMDKFLVKMCLNEKINFKKSIVRKKHRSSAIYFFTKLDFPNSGSKRIKRIDGLEFFKKKGIEINLNLNHGLKIRKKIPNLESASTRIGYFICFGQTRADTLKKVNVYKKKIKLKFYN